MNFNELFQKMRELDQPVTEEPNEGNAFSGALDAAKDAGKDEFEVDGKTFQVKEDEVEECGDMPMPGGMMSRPGQQDSISANISMNASGTGGIRDLMDILKNIEHGSDGDSPMALEPLVDVDEAEFANSPDTEVAPLAAAFPTGDDMHSKGAEFPKVNGGGNPMSMESLTNRLGSLYEEIKSR